MNSWILNVRFAAIPAFPQMPEERGVLVGQFLDPRSHWKEVLM